jgi:hypothetical protein
MTDDLSLIERIERLEAAQRRRPHLPRRARQHYDDDDVERLPTTKVAARYNVSTRSIERWSADPSIGFPAPTVVINGRKYWSVAELEAHDRKMVQAVAVGAKRPRRPAVLSRRSAA